MPTDKPMQLGMIGLGRMGPTSSAASCETVTAAWPTT